MIKYLIIDDEYIAHDIIKDYCDLLPNLQLMKNCYDAIEALEYLSQHNVDLIFLDLNMPKLKGFDFLKTLSSPPKIIVTSAYKEYALEGYELGVVDYLLKPFSFERFLKAINKAASTTSKVTSTSAVDKSDSNKTIFLKSNKKYVQINIDEIQYIESAGNYLKVMTTSELVTIREKLSDFVASLSKDDFLQVHKSFAVAKKYIKSVEGNRISIGKDLIPIGKMYKMQVMDFLGL